MARLRLAPACHQSRKPHTHTSMKNMHADPVCETKPSDTHTVDHSIRLASTVTGDQSRHNEELGPPQNHEHIEVPTARRTTSARPMLHVPDTPAYVVEGAVELKATDVP